MRPIHLYLRRPLAVGLLIASVQLGIQERHAVAELVYTEDFEGYFPGQVPIGWDVDGGPDSSFVVVSSATSASRANSLRVETVTRHHLAQSVEGSLRASFSMRLASGWTHPNTDLIYIGVIPAVPMQFDTST